MLSFNIHDHVTSCGMPSHRTTVQKNWFNLFCFKADLNVTLCKGLLLLDLLLHRFLNV